MNKRLLKLLPLFGKPSEYLNDKRLSCVGHVSYEHELKQYGTLQEWETHKEELRKRILVSAGLWPMPEKCDLNVRIFDRMEFDDFKVEKVVFESYPGFYVTGNLYRPFNKKGPFPGILNTHGHWKNGRFEHSDTSDIPTRCANFAKMGFAAFSYDMVGYCDSKQLEHEYEGFAHELWAVGLFGLQLWNSIRCIDFLQSLPDVDPDKIGCTGASGGGTQAYSLAAVDERIMVNLPVNMVSGIYQGGCTCENAANLRIGTNNVEIASIMAPRPMFLVGCTGDWTCHLPNVEYPAIKEIYELYNAGEMVDYYFEDADHNYNKNAREAAYRWFSKHLLSLDKAWKEQEVDFGDLADLSIFPGDQKPNGIASAKELFDIQIKGKSDMIRFLWSKDEADTKKLLLTLMEYVMGINKRENNISNIESKLVSVDDLVIEKMIIGTAENGEQIPLVIIEKNKVMENWTDLKRITIIIHPGGKMAFFGDEKWNSSVQELLDEYCSVAAPDVFLTGEFNTPYCAAGRDYSENSKTNKWGGTGIFTTYNYSDTALRVQDIVMVYRYIQSRGFDEINITGLGDAGLWVLGALPFIDGVNVATIDLNGFDEYDDSQYIYKFFIPGFLAAGGFDTCKRLGGQKKLVLLNVRRRE